MGKIKFNMDKLTETIKNLKGEGDKVVRVGIIGSKAHSSHGKTKDGKSSSLTNAEIGTFHEFGSKNGKHPPRRSFLAEPLSMKLDVNKDKELKKSFFKNLFKKKKTSQDDASLLALGQKAVQIIEGAFLTAGYGTWKPLAKGTWAGWERKEGISGWKTARSIATFRKGLRKSLDRTPLIDTGKLKGSISFKIKKK